MKISVGLIGNSFALIADGIESLADIFSSLAVWSGIRISKKQVDHDHPWGHGKAEAIATMIASAALLGSAALIAYQALVHIGDSQQAPASFTIPVLRLNFCP